MDRKLIEGRSRDGKSRVRKTGFSKFSYQSNRGKSFKYSSYNKKLDTRKIIYKPYGRNLAINNRKYFNRGNSFFLRNKRKVVNKFEDKTFGNSNDKNFFQRKSKNIIPRRRNTYRNNKRRNFFFKKNQKLHNKIGKLTSKDLDDELDGYMGTSNVKTRLDNDLDSYFKNSTLTQVGTNNGFNKGTE